MNWNRFFIAFVVIYVVGGILNYLMHGIIMMGTYESITGVWRPDMERLWWIQWITPLFMIFFFLYIFVRGYEGKGLMEGVRYGLIIWAFVSIPMTYGQYMLYPLPYSLVWKWLATDLIAFLVYGIIAAAIYKPAETKEST